MVFSDSELRKCIFPLLAQLLKVIWEPAGEVWAWTPGFLGATTYLSAEMSGWQHKVLKSHKPMTSRELTWFHLVKLDSEYTLGEPCIYLK